MIARRMKGKGWYMEPNIDPDKKSERIGFTIEIEVDEKGNFTGKTSEKSPCGTIARIQGKIDDEKIEFEKRYNPDQDPIRYILLIRDKRSIASYQYRYTGIYTTHVLEEWDNSACVLHPKAEITFQK